MNVYYDLDATNGDQWTAIAPVGSKAQSGSTGTPSIEWAIPATVTNTARIRLESPYADTDLNVELESSQFQIGAKFDITEPENGAPVYAGKTYNIKWNTLNGSDIDLVKLEYLQSGSTWLTIGTGGNTGSMSWNVPETLTDLTPTNHKVRIIQFDPLNTDATVTNEGAGNFSILGELQLRAPTVNESWDVNSTQTIEFSKNFGDIQSVDVYYAHDGATWVKKTATPIDVSDATGVTNGSGWYEFPWFLDPAPGETALTNQFAGLIKVVAVNPTSQANVEGVQSPGNIEVKGAISVVTPDADGITLDLDPASTYAISWSPFGDVTNVEIHYSVTGGIAEPGGSYPGANLIAAVNASPSSLDWDVADAIGTKVRIRVRDANNINVWDESSYMFRIRGKLILTTPDTTGITWKVGKTYNIQWKSNGNFTPLELHFDPDITDGEFNGTEGTHWDKINDSVTNCTPSGGVQCTDGSYTWQIPSVMSVSGASTIGSNVKVKIVGTGTENDVQDISLNPFKIVGQIEVTQPESSEVWNVGDTTVQIKWTATGIMPNVKIEYKITSAGSPVTIKASDGGHNAAGPNSYTWNVWDTGTGVADIKSEDVYILVSDVNYYTQTVNVSTPAFSIRPEINVSAPSGSATRLEVGSNNPNLINLVNNCSFSFSACSDCVAINFLA